MNPPPPSALPPPTPRAGFPSDRRQKLMWAVACTLVAFPLYWNLGDALRRSANQLLEWEWLAQPFRVGLFKATVAVAATLAVVGLGWWRQWYERPLSFRIHVLFWYGVASLALAFGVSFPVVRHTSTVRVILSNLGQIRAGGFDFFNANPYRIFAKYEEIVGLDRYVKVVNPVVGEDPGSLFPRQRGLFEYEDLFNALAGAERYRSRRLPPRPALPDGVHVTKLDDGRWFETTWQGGRPHGPFHARFPDGTLWGEARYERGRVVGPVWLHTRDGRKLDELADGEAAAKAIEASLAAAAEVESRKAAARLDAKDTAGALAVLTPAIAGNPLDKGLRRMRAEIRKSLGDLDGAIEDYCAMEGILLKNASSYSLPAYLKDLFAQRARM